MRQFVIIVSAGVCAAVLAVVAAPASASTTSTFEATFQQHFGRGVAPLPCDVTFCSEGTVAGYGHATGATTIISVRRVPGTYCIEFTATSTITLADGSTLSVDASGTRCPVGGSHDAPGHLVSYGNPITTSGTFTITGGTGVFAGASGSGTFKASSAGDVEVTELSGTLTLP
jgi:hypothetical protein